MKTEILSMTKPILCLCDSVDKTNFVSFNKDSGKFNMDYRACNNFPVPHRPTVVAKTVSFSEKRRFVNGNLMWTAQLAA